jgi:NADH-quinone oxidoreductase subunit D
VSPAGASIPNFNRIGGVKPAAGAGSTQRKTVQDLPEGLLRETKLSMERVLAAADELEAWWPATRSSRPDQGHRGLPVSDRSRLHVRRVRPQPAGIGGPLRPPQGRDYLPYDKFDFDIPVGKNGDCWDRWWVRLQEIRQSARIVAQAVDGIPSGPLQAKVPKVIKVPKGETYVRAENPKGEMGYYIVSEGGQGPYRLKIRSASFSNISILPWAWRVCWSPTSSPSWAPRLRAGGRGPMRNVQRRTFNVQRIVDGAGFHVLRPTFYVLPALGNRPS